MTVETLRNRGALRRLGAEIGELYNREWKDHAEFRPLTTAELNGLVADLVTIATPELITVLWGPGGELAGSVLPFPDLTPALQRSGGDLGLRSILDLRRERRRTTHCIVNGLGLLPEYRNRGGTVLLYTHLMLGDLETLGGEIYRRHRVYEMGV